MILQLGIETFLNTKISMLDSKSPEAVNVSVNGGLSLYVRCNKLATRPG